MTDFSVQYKDPRWQRKRLEVLSFYEFKCMECGSTESQLHVHHPYYIKGKMIWDYEGHDLQCLCGRCHKESHAIDSLIKDVMSVLTLKHKRFIASFVSAFSRIYRPADMLSRTKDKHSILGVGLGVEASDKFRGVE